MSRYTNDEIINKHPRFWTITHNIVERLGEKPVEIFIPDD